MNPEILDKLVTHAKNDVQLFHDLVFHPEKALKELDYVDRETKANFLLLDPERIFTHITRGRQDFGESGNCSCTTGTCDGTCGGSTCDVTCSGESCGRTCDDSCGYTTNYDFTTTQRFPAYGRNIFNMRHFAARYR